MAKASDVLKKTGKTDGKSNRLGKGGRFKQMEDKGMSARLAAYIGRKVHGAKDMAKWSAADRKKK